MAHLEKLTIFIVFLTICWVQFWLFRKLLKFCFLFQDSMTTLAPISTGSKRSSSDLDVSSWPQVGKSLSFSINYKWIYPSKSFKSIQYSLFCIHNILFGGRRAFMLPFNSVPLRMGLSFEWNYFTNFVHRGLLVIMRPQTLVNVFLFFLKCPFDPN